MLSTRVANTLSNTVQELVVEARKLEIGWKDGGNIDNSLSYKGRFEKEQELNFKFKISCDSAIPSLTYLLLTSCFQTFYFRLS